MFIEQRSYYEVWEQKEQVKQHKKKPKSRKKLKQLIEIALVLAVGIIITSCYATIAKMSYINESLSKQYSQIEAQNKELKLQLARSKNLQRIEYIAVNKLGMVKPDETQIVYVKVPKVNKKAN
ncbi:Cell division protein FtsL [Caldanaerobius fijiensis DSM 17918]|uniref:Cell division protein FtsL n=1 Tax=Caldanaerobius fijiensis DSM 17918 TaxID=1121256 RepID=A0A1M4T325_9THEO|nr:cell division protein FtsL [Caldanaerobius fijiensis]SHE38866.1 Cell division protein FtsL [Caldanaerobius fijiensis DSM 17918]